MKSASVKQKGRLFQQWVRDQILSRNPELAPDDVRSTSMGASGEDILLSTAARKVFPFSIECKNVEKINVWSAYAQCLANAKQYAPILFLKKNRTDAVVVLDAEFFLDLMQKFNEMKVKHG